MKFEIDTDNKTIVVKQQTNLEELVVYLKKLLGKEFKQYKLETNIVVNTSPLYPLLPVTAPTRDPYWWETPITVSSNNETKAFTN